MFKVAKERILTEDVVVRFPSEGGKGWATGKITATFRFLSKSQIGEAAEEEHEDPKGARDFLDRVLISVKGVGDADGNELPNEEARQVVIDDTFARGALLTRYWELSQGKPKK